MWVRNPLDSIKLINSVIQSYMPLILFWYLICMWMFCAVPKTVCVVSHEMTAVGSRVLQSKINLRVVYALQAHWQKFLGVKMSTLNRRSKERRKLVSYIVRKGIHSTYSLRTTIKRSTHLHKARHIWSIFQKREIWIIVCLNMQHISVIP